MTIKEINKAYRRILDCLDQGELKTAFELIQSLIVGQQNQTFQVKLDQLRETYQYLLQYFAEGTKDPMRKQIYASIRTGLYELSDQVKHTAFMIESSQTFYETNRNLSIQNIDTKSLLVEIQSDHEIGNHSRSEASLIVLFDKIWSTIFLSETDSKIIHDVIINETFPSIVKCQIVSALLIGLQVNFDKEKLNLLFDATSSKDDEVKIRSFIGILLTLHAYQKRINFYPFIQHRIEAISEYPDFKHILKTIITRFILSKETEKITDKLQKEIIPKMMKLSPKINPANPWAEFNSDISGSEMNPEWKDLYTDKELTKKIEEYGQLQEEGMDVMHSTFIHLKHFPFFKKISNWFLPFNINNSSFKNDALVNNKTLETMMQASFMCNSDKYSLCFSLFQIPEEYRNAMMSQIDSQISQMNVQEAQELKTKYSKIEIITSQYIQDLYRFYKLFPRKYDFEDIFDWTLDFHQLPILNPYISDPESLSHIAEFYFRKGYFSNAQTIFEELSLIEGTEVLYQKLGYCKQMSGDLEGALQEYLRSEMIQPDSKWLVRRIATCYRALKQPEQALHYFKRYEQMNPDQTANQISIGNCYMELVNYGEALNYYFKADYLEPESQKAWRAIAWCSFLYGKYEQAQKYYLRIIANKPSIHDYLNAGHTEWALHNIKQAIDYYKSAAKTDEQDWKTFKEIFFQDIPEMKKAGIDTSEIPLILDQIQFSMV